MAGVTLTNVGKSYAPGRPILSGVNVAIADGEFAIIVGPSGCGKSTLLRMLAGLEEISEGEIAIDGRVVNRVPAKDRDIAMVFQNYALYPHMSVAENMGFGLRMRRYPHAEIDKRVKAAAEMLGSHRTARAQAGGALRGTAPARRHGSCHRAAAEAVPVRRAAQQPGREVAGRDARGADQAPPPARGDDDLRDPRPGRGDDAWGIA